MLRGFAKLNIFQRSKKNLDRAHRIHPPPSNPVFFNPTTSWTEHSNRNNQPLLAIYRQNTHGLLLQNISTGLGLFWDDFPHKNIPSETWIHPPTSIVISDFWIFFLCNTPYWVDMLFLAIVPCLVWTVLVSPLHPYYQFHQSCFVPIYA